MEKCGRRDQIAVDFSFKNAEECLPVQLECSCHRLRRDVDAFWILIVTLTLILNTIEARR